MVVKKCSDIFLVTVVSPGKMGPLPRPELLYAFTFGVPPPLPCPWPQQPAPTAALFQGPVLGPLEPASCLLGCRAEVLDGLHPVSCRLASHWCAPWEALCAFPAASSWPIQLKPPSEEPFPGPPGSAPSCLLHADFLWEHVIHQSLPTNRSVQESCFVAHLGPCGHSEATQEVLDGQMRNQHMNQMFSGCPKISLRGGGMSHPVAAGRPSERGWRGEESSLLTTRCQPASSTRDREGLLEAHRFGRHHIPSPLQIVPNTQSLHVKLGSGLH